MNQWKSVIVTLFLLLCMPVNVYAQTFGWFSGFANYNMGMFFSLFMIYVVQKNNSWALILIISFFGQFFMENITLYNIFAALVLFVLWKQRATVLVRLSYLIGTVTGAAVMFSNSVYHMIEIGADNYRRFDFGNIIKVFFNQYLSYFLVKNMVVVVVLSLLMIYFIRKNKEQYPIRLFITCYTTGIVYFNIAGLEMNAIPFVVTIVITIATIGYLFCILRIIQTNELFSTNRQDILFFGLSTGIILSPFLVIEPFGPRAEFTSYLFWVIVICILVDKIPASINYNKALIPIVSVMGVCLLGIHLSNFYVFVNRMNHVRISNDKKTVKIYDVPFSKFGHHISPPKAIRVSHHSVKTTYGIPVDTEVVFEKYSNPTLR